MAQESDAENAYADNIKAGSGAYGYQSLASKTSTNTDLQYSTADTTITNVETHIGLSFCLCFAFPFTGIPALIFSLEARKALQAKDISTASAWSRRAKWANTIGAVAVLLLSLAFLIHLIFNWWLAPVVVMAKGPERQEQFRTMIVTSSPPYTFSQRND